VAESVVGKRVATKVLQVQPITAFVMEEVEGAKKQDVPNIVPEVGSVLNTVAEKNVSTKGALTMSCMVD